MGCPCRAAGVGISGEPSCSSGTVPTSLGNGAACPAMVGLASVAQVTRWCQVDLASALCSVSSASVFHGLRNYCLPGFYQDNIQCALTLPLKCSARASGWVEETRIPRQSGLSLPKQRIRAKTGGTSPEPWHLWPSWARLQPQLQLLTSYL